MRREDEVRLRHMLDAAREAASFVKGRKRSDLDADYRARVGRREVVSGAPNGGLMTMARERRGAGGRRRKA